MKKQEFKFVFPVAGEAIVKKMNPLAIKETAVSYLKKQCEIRGDICIIFDSHDRVIAMAYINERMNVSFFTQDEDVNDIVSLYEEEGGSYHE